MKYGLEDLPCIPDQERNCLSSHGIRTTDDILLRLALPEQRKQFSQHSCIPVEELTHWASVADLIRIKGMGVITAELLIHSGQVNSLQQFIDEMILAPVSDTRSTTGWQVIQKGFQDLFSILSRTFHLSRHPQEPVTPEIASGVRIAERKDVLTAAHRLHERISACAKQMPDRRHIPSVNRLAELAEEAVELRPRLVIETNDGNLLFRQTMKVRAWGMSKTILGLCAIFWAVTVVFSGGLSWINAKQLRDLVASFPEPAAGFEQLKLYPALLRVSVDALLNSSMILAAVILLIIVPALVLVSFSPMFITYPSSTLLMNNAVHRSFFVKAIQVPLRRERRTSLVAILLITLIALPVVMYAYTTDFEPSLQSLTHYSLPVAIFGALIGVIASSAMYHHILTGIAIDWEKEQESLKRYLLYMLVHILYAFVGIYLLIYFVFTTTPGVYNFIYEHYIRPSYHQALSATCDEQALHLADNDDTSPLYGIFKNYCNQGLKPLVIERYEPNIRMLDPNRSLWSQGGPGMGWMVNTLFVWMFLTGVLLLFVLPYFSAGGWWRGIFYVVILFVASRLENFLTANSASLLGLDAGNLSTRLVIGFFILTSALIFDWIYDALSEKKKVCPNCQSLIDDFSYCPVCGLVQQ